MSFSNGQARARAAVVPMHADARVSSPQTSQVVAGHVVTLLQQTGDWWLVRSADGYEGHVHRGYLEPSSGAEGTWRVSLGVIVHEHDGRERALPVGARVADDALVVSGNIVLAKNMAHSFPLNGTAVAHTATTYYTGASYQWGGVSEWGCDCSGLVQSVFALHGLQLPRDAYQQAECGVAVDGGEIGTTAAQSRLADGDLLFFSDREDRRITHIGIAITGGGMIHSALGRGGVSREVLNSDDAYVQQLRRNFVVARRVL